MLNYIWGGSYHLCKRREFVNRFVDTYTQVSEREKRTGNIRSLGGEENRVVGGDFSHMLLYGLSAHMITRTQFLWKRNKRAWGGDCEKTEQGPGRLRAYKMPGTGLSLYMHYLLSSPQQTCEVVTLLIPILT